MSGTCSFLLLNNLSSHFLLWSLEWLDENSRKAEIQKEHSIFMRLSKISTNELHKYLYLYFMFYSYFNYQFSITIWIRLTEIYKMTIACFIPTISVGSTLTHVRFITWTTQCTCWLVVRNCDRVWFTFKSSKSFGAIVDDHNFVHQVFGTVAGEWTITISCTMFLAPLLGIVRVWTTDSLFCCSD